MMIISKDTTFDIISKSPKKAMSAPEIASVYFNKYPIHVNNKSFARIVKIQLLTLLDQDLIYIFNPEAKRNTRYAVKSCK